MEESKVKSKFNVGDIVTLESVESLTEYTNKYWPHSNVNQNYIGDLTELLSGQLFEVESTYLTGTSSGYETYAVSLKNNEDNNWKIIQDYLILADDQTLPNLFGLE